MNVEIRPASADDAELIHRLSRQAWCGTIDASSSLFAETVDHVAGVLARGGGFILLVDGEPSGSVRHFPSADDPTSWEVKRLGVLAPLRRRGLGAALMGAVDGAARRSGVRSLRLGIRTDQPQLIPFYRGLGFEIDDSVRLASQHQATTSTITMSRRLPSE
jgi:GNAT superfamily N-acetyltransferase